MDSARPENTKHLLSLKDASEKLGVTVDQLLKWNDYNILKPTITLSGEIGYTKEQIENFQMIQRLAGQNITQQPSPNISLPRKDLLPANLASSTVSPSTAGSIPAQANTKVILSGAEEFSLKSITNSFSPRSFVALSTCSFLFFIGIFVALSQNPSLPRTNSNKTATSEKTPVVTLAANGSSKKSADSKLSNQAEVLDENKLSKLNDQFGTESAQVLPSEEPFELPAAVRDSKTGSIVGGEFASRPNCPTCVDGQPEKQSIFDDKGNIKGEPETKDQLAVTTLGSPDPAQPNSSSSQITNITLLIFFVSFGLLSLAYIFRSQFAYTGGAVVPAQEQNIFQTQSHHAERLLEIDQKTDGTVVLYFQGKEHKISKPELDSESDQFITRLMELAENDSKEIDYDILSDEKIRFHAPLSKLATRLGFVGIKRDIFFPRTSKNRVLFRKYVTEQDLASMSLTIEQVSQYL